MTAWWSLVGVVVFGLGACTNGPGGMVCSPGAASACTCSDGRAGAQTCNGAGTAFGSCTCTGDGGTTMDGGPTSCGPATCSGCCQGATCVTSTSAAACGTGGGVCATCTSGFTCLGGTCDVDASTLWTVTLFHLHVSSTTYDGSAWDLGGGAPDPFVDVIVGSATSTPTMTGTANNVFDVDFLGGPTTTESAGALSTYLGFQVWDSDVTTNDPIGFCTFAVTTDTFRGATQTVTCPVDASTMNSGFTLTFQLAPAP